jgi:PKD repeat protein
MSLKLFLASSFLAILSVSCYGQWKDQPSPTSYTINKIHFLTENLGFLGTNSGLYKTVDGGKTWVSPQYPIAFDSQLLNAAFVYDIHFFDQNHGLIAGSGFYNTYDIIAKTSDGGATWYVVYYQSFQNGVSRPTLSDMTFLNEQVGYCVGGNGKILKTINGGDGWSVITSPAISNLTAIHFINSDIGFIVGENVILKSIDAGISWVATSFDFRISDIHFFSETKGIATTLEGKILVTENGGGDWTAHPVDFNAMLGKMAFQNDAGYAVAFDALANKFILKTTDGGKVWERQDVSTTYNLAGIGITPSGKAWVGGSRGQLFATTNGGDPSYPIASFTPSHTAFCQNLNYTFKNNGPEGVYTYSWYVDGALKSTNYNFSTTFTPGSHSVELRASKGMLTSTAQQNIGVEHIFDFAKPLELEFKDGICAGEAAVITVKNAQYGTYKLYDGNVVIATDAEYYPEVVLQTPALQATKTFRVSATRPSSCQTIEITADANITVYGDLREGSTVRTVKDYICNEGQPIVEISASKSHVLYEMYHNGKVVSSGIGNSNTLTLTAAAIRDTSEFLVKTSAVNGVCTKWFRDTIKVNVERVKADFYLSTRNAAAGENINVYNKSEGATDFQWTFPGAFVNSSILDSPDPIAFIGAGSYNTTLVAASPTGCSDNAIVTMDVYDDAPLPSCWAAGVGVSSLFNMQYASWNHNYSVAVDPAGDVLTTGMYVGQAEFDSKLGKGYTTLEAVHPRSFLAKYTSKGALKWVVNTAVYENWNQPKGSFVKVAADGSIYLLTWSGSSSIEFYSANGDTVRMPTEMYASEYLIKYTSDGIIEWVRALGTSSSNDNPITDFEIDAAGNSYMAFYHGNLWRWSASGDFIDEINVTPSFQRPEVAVAPDGSFYTIHALDANSLSVQRFTSTGQLEWNKSIRGAGHYEYYGRSTVSTDNDLVLYGSARGNVYFESEGEEDKVAPSSGFFIARYGASGKVKWVNTSISGSGVWDATGIVSNTSGHTTLAFNLSSEEPMVLQSQDGNHTSANYTKKPYLVTYDAEGNIVMAKALLDEYVMGQSIDMAIANDQVYIVGNLFNEYRRTEQLNGDVSICFGNPGVIDQSTIYSEQESVLFVAKIDDCNWQYRVFEATINGLPAYGNLCVGTGFDVSYSIRTGIIPAPDNVYHVLLYNFNENCRMSIGRLAGNATEGVIHATIPDNLPSGNYTISVLATNPKLYTNPERNTIIVSGVSNFDFTYTSVADLTLSFNATTDMASAYTWMIDGAKIEGMSVTYKFPTTGTFPACLIVRDECGVERTICKDVAVTCAVVPTDFNYTVTERTVVFKGISQAKNTLQWDFGDGTSTTGLNVQHTYSTFGDKYVCLRSSTSCNTGIACKTIKLTCLQGPLAFSYTAADKKVQFSNNSAAEYTSLIWSFGDGTTSTENSPLHTYAQPGNYTVMVKSTGLCDEQKTVSQIVMVTCAVPTPAFSTATTNLDVTFTNTSSEAKQVLWTFGDGTTSSAVSPQHSYAVAGSYYVCLTVTNACTQKSICSIVTVSNAAPEAPLTLTASTLSHMSIALRWSDNSTTEQSYNIEYKVAAASQYQLLTTLAANTTQCIAADLACGTLYNFRVRAVGQGSNNVSAWKEVTGGTLGLATPIIEIVNYDIICVTVSDAYQWYVDNMPITGANDSKIAPGKSGSYKVEISDDGCKAMSAEVAFVITGIEDYSSQIDLYPLPAHDVLTIAFDESAFRSVGSITLINISGNNALTVMKANGEETVALNVAHLPAGLYVCMISVSGKTLYRKVNIY